MMHERRAALESLYPGKSYGVAMKLWVEEHNDGSWRERDAFTGDGSYVQKAVAYWTGLVGGGGDTFRLLAENGDLLQAENADYLRTE